MSALSGRVVHRGDDGGGGRWPECRCEACFATRLVPLPRAAVLASRVVLGVLSGAAAVVITLGW